MVRRRKRSRADAPEASPPRAAAETLPTRRRKAPLAVALAVVAAVVAALLIWYCEAAAADGGRGTLCRVEAPARGDRPEPGRDHARHDASRSPRLLRVSRRRDSEHRRAGQGRDRLRLRDGHGAAHLPVALVDLHGPRPSAPRRARQRRLLPRRREGHPGGAASREGRRHGRLRRRLGARAQVGARPGLRRVLGPVRPLEVQGDLARHGAEAGGRGDGRRARVARGREAASLLRVGPSLRPPHALRPARAVRLALPEPAVSRRDRVHRPGGRAAAELAPGARPLRAHPRRPDRRPRREPRRPRRVDPRLLRLRLHHARAARGADAVGNPRAALGAGLERRPDADRARPAGPSGAAGDRRPLARARDPRSRRDERPHRLLGDLLPALPLRLAAPARDPQPRLQVRRRSRARALRPRAGPGRDEEHLPRLLGPRRGPAPAARRAHEAGKRRGARAAGASTPRRCSGWRRSGTSAT